VISIQPEIQLREIITLTDWCVFFGVLALTFAAIVYGHYKRKNIATDEAGLLDYLIMGRQLTLPLFIGTLVATWYGGIFGVTQIAFESGIYNFITQGVFWYFTYFIFAIFIVKKIKQSNAMTLPELVGQMFGPLSGKLSAVFNFFNVVPIAYAISLGLFIQALFGGSLILSTSIGVFVVISYSMIGGLRSVVFSDLIQFFVMCFAVLLIAILSVSNFGGYEFLKMNLPETHFKLTGGHSLSTTLVWGFIALATLVDPNFYQRCFAARSDKVARNGILISILIWVCFDICTTAGGMYARAVIPEAESGTAYLTYALQILPNGFRGFVLAGILATILSTIDSYILIAGTTLSYDLLPKRFRNKKLFHYLGILFVGLLSVILSTYFDGSIKMVWKVLGSYLAACLLLPVLIGYAFPKKITDKQFVFACFVGAIATTYWRVAEHTGFWKNVDEIYVGSLATVLGLLIYKLNCCYSKIFKS
jgi:SSS family solute:Na+ symporter